MEFLAAALPAFVVRRRSVMLAAIESISETLVPPMRPRWISANAPAAGTHFPPVHFPTAHFAYVDSEFSTDLAHGVPIAGHIPAAGALNPRFRSAVATLEGWSADIPSRKRQILERVKASHGAEISAGCWNSTLGKWEEGGPRCPRL